ncbi:hypothetical protein LOZ15_003389 [Ophidiomyces ophidiicola]|nr:hypothetical protein LOZ15_003389 [Ophidiomyces ophidiicola]
MLDLVGQADGVHGPLQQRAPGDVERAEDGLEQLAAPALRPPAGVETAQDDAVVGEDDQGHGAAGLEVCEVGVGHDDGPAEDGLPAGGGALEGDAQLAQGVVVGGALGGSGGGGGGVAGVQVVEGGGDVGGQRAQAGGVGGAVHQRAQAALADEVPEGGEHALDAAEEEEVVQHLGDGLGGGAGGAVVAGGAGEGEGQGGGQAGEGEDGVAVGGRDGGQLRAEGGQGAVLVARGALGVAGGRGGRRGGGQVQGGQGQQAVHEERVRQGLARDVVLPDGLVLVVVRQRAVGVRGVVVQQLEVGQVERVGGGGGGGGG